MPETGRSARPDRALLVAAWFVLLTMKLGLTALTYRRLRRWLGVSPDLPDAPEPVARRVAAHVGRAARALPHASCLARALAVQFLLARKGYGSAVHVGVANLRSDGRFEAHAWLTSGGEPVIGGDVPGFGDYAPLIEIR